MTVTCDRAIDQRQCSVISSVGAELLADLQERVESTLAELLPSRDVPPVNLHAAMRYSVLAPGKRLRPMLTLLAAGNDGAGRPEVVRLACVSELVHAASLILDDLPCMDDAQVRRSQPCTHLLYSESTAILASVNLLNLAFGVVATCPEVGPDLQAATVAHLSQVVGSSGLVGGQVIDLNNTEMTVERAAVERMYQQKTGGLFEFALVTGGRLGGLSGPTLMALSQCAKAFGLWFQVRDDLLDRLGSAGEVGKDVGKDDKKATLVALQSLDETRQVLAQAQMSVRDHLNASGLGHSRLSSFIEAQLASSVTLAGDFGARA